MIERPKPPALSEPWRFIVATRDRDADHWDVALFVDQHLAERYYLDVAIANPRVAEGCIAAVTIHHTRP